MSMGSGCLLRSILPNKAWRYLMVGHLQLPGAGARKMSNGAIRRGGGAFSKREEALEEMYFKKKEKELIDTLKTHHEEEIAAQQKEIQRLQENIKWHESKVENLEDQKTDDTE
ncbi:ATPase inhibitor B, mitochondrial-like [Leucoraja erinacea]|uniref:ATPase inhibitor B, mitochondrial-like n=1 Tax=Leucoraja erinaceus TaxID=7782 RepID=UPI0024573C48|nr:ATPase inhibitor B, mitochondrial-like [Leucoraja erinacea]